MSNIFRTLKIRNPCYFAYFANLPLASTHDSVIRGTKYFPQFQVEQGDTFPISCHVPLSTPPSERNQWHEMG